MVLACCRLQPSASYRTESECTKGGCRAKSDLVELKQETRARTIAEASRKARLTQLLQRDFPPRVSNCAPWRLLSGPQTFHGSCTRVSEELMQQQSPTGHPSAIFFAERDATSAAAPVLANQRASDSSRKAEGVPLALANQRAADSHRKAEGAPDQQSQQGSSFPHRATCQDAGPCKLAL